MSKKVGLLVGLVAVFNLFLYHTVGSVASVVASISILLFVVSVFGIGKQGKLVAAVTAFVSLLCFALLCSANGAVNFVAGISILASIFWLGYLLSARKEFFDGVGEFIFSPVSVALSYLEGIAAVFRLRSNKLFSIVRGLILGVPVLLIVVGLLASGDVAYGHFISEVLKNIQRLVVHVIFSAILLGFLLPYVFSKFTAFSKKIYGWTLPVKTEVAILVGLVILVLGSFLIVQWPYVFVSVPREIDLKQIGVATYSEYVNRGFTEFLAVALIVYGLVWTGLWVKSPRLLQFILFGEFAVFIVSIFRRIALYQQYHGWTLARIYGGFFLVWASGLMAILFWRHFSKKNLLSAELVFTAAIVLIFSYFNAESFVARSGGPTVNNRVDYAYLSRLSPDGYEGWIKAANYSRSVLLDEALFRKPLLNKDDRREIFYAGSIMWNLKEKDRQKSNDLLDKIFSYNWSESQALAQWHKVISPEQLVTMEQYYNKLVQKIDSQPESERNWEIDTSLQSPFL